MQWLRCKTCKHIHSELWREHKLAGKQLNCTSNCCVTDLTQTTVRTCPACSGRGSYKDHDEARYQPYIVTCSMCNGLAVISNDA